LYISALVYADDVNIFVTSVHAIKRHTNALLVGSKEIGLEVNADKTKYMVMSRDQKQKKSLYKD
jgi:hypothetical protein